MSAVRLGTRLALCAGLGLIFVGCGAAPAEETEGGAGSNVPVVTNYPTGDAGQFAMEGFKGWRRPGSAGSSGAMAGAPATVAGSSGAAGGNASAAGSGGIGGAAGTAGGPAAGSGASAASDPLDVFGMGSAGAAADDPFDIFNAAPGMISCVGLLCAELADCTSLYPSEHAACKFTQCVDLECR